MGQGGVAAQPGRVADRQHPDPPAGAPGQGGDQVAVAGVVAVAGQHGQRAGVRPALAQGPPGGVGGALHQLETGGAGSDQPGIEVAHLGGAVERKGKIVG
ncbi:hypothetical protein D9M70_327420 [compost metagenome]